MFNDDPSRNAVLSRSERLRAEREECNNDHPWHDCPKCGIGICGDHVVAFLNHSSHKPPALRAGERERGDQGDRVSVELIDGEAGRCIGINDYRICGPKPIHGVVVSSWTTTKNDVLRAFLTPDEKHDWLAKELQVIPVEQHATLVEQRDLALQVLKGVAIMLNTNLSSYDEEPWAQRVRAVIATIEQEGAR